MRKQKIFLILVLFFFAGNIFAQNGWQWVNPIPTGNDLNKVKFINSRTGYAIGYNGTVIRTTNGGINWSIKNINTDSSGNKLALSIISVVDSNIVYCYGIFNGILFNPSRLLRSTDSGNNWIQVSNANSSQVKDFHFVNAMTGFLFAGVIYKTTNGGVTWTLNYAPSVTYTDIEFINENTGFIGGTGNILKTTNQGVSWEPSYSGASDLAFSNIDFINNLTGYAVSYTYPQINKIFKTTNTGLNWELMRVIPAFGSDYKLDFNVNGKILGTSADLNFGKIFRSSNEGVTWDTAALYAWPMHLSAPSSDTCFVVSKNGLIYKTVNFGNNWINTSLQFGNLDNLTSLNFIDESTGFITGLTGTIIKTTNSGANWNYSKVSNYHLSSIYFLNNQTGYIGSSYGKILKTTNIGISWDTINYDPALGNHMVSSVYFTNSNTGFITIYDFNYFYKTTNAGLNWSVFPMSTSFPTYLVSLNFVNSLTGYVCENFVGGGPHSPPNTAYIYRTTNSGTNWSKISTISNVNGTSLKFINENTGYFNCGNIYKTYNGGVNWSLVINGVNSPDLKADGENIVYAGGYKSTNAGINWILYNITVPSVVSLQYINANTGISITGNGGGILRTTDGGEIITSITPQQTLQTPKSILLHQNYPNPFNPSTRINYELKITNYVTLKVFDLLGKEVATLVNEKQIAGSYAVDFNSTEFNLPSGIYFYTLNAGEFKETKKMVLVK